MTLEIVKSKFLMSLIEKVRHTTAVQVSESRIVMILGDLVASLVFVTDQILVRSLLDLSLRHVRIVHDEEANSLVGSFVDDALEQHTWHRYLLHIASTALLTVQMYLVIFELEGLVTTYVDVQFALLVEGQIADVLLDEEPIARVGVDLLPHRHYVPVEVSAVLLALVEHVRIGYQVTSGKELSVAWNEEKIIPT